MELFFGILSSIGALASVVSAVVALRAKNEAEERLIEIKGLMRNRIELNTKGDNFGVVSGINTGEINVR